MGDNFGHKFDSKELFLRYYIIKLRENGNFWKVLPPKMAHLCLKILDPQKIWLSSEISDPNTWHAHPRISKHGKYPPGVNVTIKFTEKKYHAVKWGSYQSLFRSHAMLVSWCVTILFFPEVCVMNISIGTDYMLSRVAKIAGWIRIWVALSFKLLLGKWRTFLPT